jgi:hypothetical protein
VVERRGKEVDHPAGVPPGGDDLDAELDELLRRGG